jgi:hypothetical protein
MITESRKEEIVTLLEDTIVKINKLQEVDVKSLLSDLTVEEYEFIANYQYEKNPWFGSETSAVTFLAVLSRKVMLSGEGYKRVLFSQDQLELAKWLIDKGADVNAGNPLYNAVELGYLELVELLASHPYIDINAYVHTQITSRCALHIAISGTSTTFDDDISEERRHEIVECLVNNKADVALPQLISQFSGNTSTASGVDGSSYIFHRFEDTGKQQEVTTVELAEQRGAWGFNANIETQTLLKTAMGLDTSKEQLEKKHQELEKKHQQIKENFKATGVLDLSSIADLSDEQKTTLVNMGKGGDKAVLLGIALVKANFDAIKQLLALKATFSSRHLLAALTTNNPEIIKLALGHLAQDQVNAMQAIFRVDDSSSRVSKDGTAMHEAIIVAEENGNLVALQQLMADGRVDINAIGFSSQRGYTGSPIELCILRQQRHEEKAEILNAAAALIADAISKDYIKTTSAEFEELHQQFANQLLLDGTINHEILQSIPPTKQQAFLNTKVVRKFDGKELSLINLLIQYHHGGNSFEALPNDYYNAVNQLIQAGAKPDINSLELAILNDAFIGTFECTCPIEVIKLLRQSGIRITGSLIDKIVDAGRKGHLQVYLPDLSEAEIRRIRQRCTEQPSRGHLHILDSLTPASQSEKSKEDKGAGTGLHLVTRRAPSDRILTSVSLGSAKEEVPLTTTAISVAEQPRKSCCSTLCKIINYLTAKTSLSTNFEAQQVGVRII